MYNDRKNAPPQGRGGGFTRPPADAGYKPTDSELSQIVVNGDAVKLNEVAGKLGAFYTAGLERERLSSSQIRSFFDKVQAMEDFDNNQLQLLRPLMAYAAGRHQGKVKHLQGIIDQSINLVKDQNSFDNFKHLLEAIVAYHRYHGGK